MRPVTIWLREESDPMISRVLSWGIRRTNEIRNHRKTLECPLDELDMT